MKSSVTTHLLWRLPSHEGNPLV